MVDLDLDHIVCLFSAPSCRSQQDRVNFSHSSGKPGTVLHAAWLGSFNVVSGTALITWDWLGDNSDTNYTVNI